MILTLPENPQTMMVLLVAIQMALYASGWVAVLVALRAERIAVGFWAVGWYVLGVGLMLLSSRGTDRTWWAFTGCNIVFLTGYSLVRLGIERFVGVDHLRETLATLAVAVGVLLWLGPGVDNAPWRVVTVYGAGAWVMCRAFFIVRPVAAEFGAGWAALTAMPILMLGLSSINWVVLQFMDMGRNMELHHFSMVNARVLLSYMVVAGVFNLSFVVLVTLRLVMRLRTQNERDALTGLYNRRALDGALGREWSRFKRSGQAFAVLMIDIDHFKQVNDTHGHAAGDRVLQEVAQYVRNASRTLDMAVRYGGEEFLVLMPLCDADGACVVAERVRAAVQAQEITLAAHTGGAGASTLRVTASVGVAAADKTDAGSAALLARADAALYAAKHAGRNRVEVSLTD
jgi:diguanylate cyclase (GGDEF)-like protein